MDLVSTLGLGNISSFVSQILNSMMLMMVDHRELVYVRVVTTPLSHKTITL